MNSCLNAVGTVFFLLYRTLCAWELSSLVRSDMLCLIAESIMSRHVHNRHRRRLSLIMIWIVPHRHGHPKKEL